MESIDDQLKLLKADLKSYSNEIITHIQSLHSTSHEGIISIKNNPKLIVQMIQQELNTIINETHYKTKEHNDQSKDVDINECHIILETLTNVSTAADMITLCDEQLDSHDLLSTCKHLNNLKNILNKLPSTNTDIGTGKVCILLHREYTILYSRFITRLQRLLRNCIHIEIGKIYVNKSLSSTDLLNDEDYIDNECITLVDIWTAIIQCSNTTTTTNTGTGGGGTGGTFSECINILITEIYIKIIRPLWKFKKIQFPRIQRGTGSSYPTHNATHKHGLIEQNICELIYSREIHCKLPILITPLIY